MNRMLYQLSYAATRSNVYYTKLEICVNSPPPGSCLDRARIGRPHSTGALGISGVLILGNPDFRFPQEDLPHPARILSPFSSS